MIGTADERIVELLRSAPLLDCHNDLVWELRHHRENGEEPDIAGSAPKLHTDLPRLEAGGVRAQFWSVYVPSDFVDPHQAVTMTLEQIDALVRLVRAHPDRLELVRTADEVERVAASGKVASLMGVEGGQSIGASLGALRVLAHLGAGYLTLTHNDDNVWADSGTGARTHGGLTAFGEEVVRELNRLGMLVDLSHTSDDVMRQAIEVSEAPPFYSHSNARALCDVQRNVPDDVIELVGRAGGVICVTFVPWFLTAAGAEASAAEWLEVERQRAAHPDDPAAVHDAMHVYNTTQPTPESSVADVADHVDHIRDLAGIEAVGIGSDFDGVEATPTGLDDVSCYPALFAELAGRGYGDDDLAKIAGRNVLRVMRAAERIAAGAGS